MKKVILGLSAVTLLLISCKKETPKVVTPPPAPKLETSRSYIKMTFLGKTLETRDTIVNETGAAPRLFPIQCDFKYYNYDDSLFDKTLGINAFNGDKYTNGNMKLVIAATSFARKKNTIRDTFRTVTTSMNAYSLQDQTNKAVYQILPNSLIIVTDTAADYTKGEIIMRMKSGSTAIIDAKGEFKIYKRDGY